MNAQQQLPENLRRLVEKVEAPVQPAELDAYSKLKDLENRSYHLRTIVDAWGNQQTQDRKLRSGYSWWLAWVLSLQLCLVNVVFILIGTGNLHYERWVTNTFVISVFGEVTSLVLIIVKYLFPQSSGKVLELLERLKGT